MLPANDPPPAHLTLLVTGSANWMVLPPASEMMPMIGSCSDGLGDTEADTSMTNSPPEGTYHYGTEGATWLKVLDGSSGTATLPVNQSVTSQDPYNSGGRFSLSVAQPAAAVPVNWRIASCVKDGDGVGTLVFNYTWDSSDGVVADMAGCAIHEYVVYPAPLNTHYSPPNPPYGPLWSLANPTISPMPGIAAQTQSLTDNQLWRPAGSNYSVSDMFPPPVSASGNFSCTQYYEYDDVFHSH